MTQDQINRQVAERVEDVREAIADDSREELAKYVLQVVEERERTVINLRECLVIAEQQLARLRRSQIDAVKEQLARLEAVR